MGIKVKGNFQLDSKKLLKEIKQDTKKDILLNGATVQCPHCKRAATLKQGKHPCPHCGKIVDATFDFTNF